MTKTITLELRVEDAEPILRQAACEAAKCGAWCDYITNRTFNSPRGSGYSLQDSRKEWQSRFLKAKRMVEAFGVEYEPTSEAETLTVDYRWVGGTRKPLGDTGFHMIVGSVQDLDNPQPCYHREVHNEACYAAAARVVRRWHDTLREAQAA